MADGMPNGRSSGPPQAGGKALLEVSNLEAWYGESHILHGVGLEIRKVQSDPFAPPSRLRVSVPAATAGLPPELHASPVRARLQPRSILALDECEDGWCRVRARRLNGWVSQRAVFGAQERALCNANRPAGTGRAE